MRVCVCPGLSRHCMQHLQLARSRCNFPAAAAEVVARSSCRSLCASLYCKASLSITAKMKAGRGGESRLCSRIYTYLIVSSTTPTVCTTRGLHSCRTSFYFSRRSAVNLRHLTRPDPHHTLTHSIPFPLPSSFRSPSVYLSTSFVSV